MTEKVPRLLAGVDIKKLKLDPMDGFLLTRIDGKLGPRELSRETGLPDFSVVRALEKLEKLGVIEVVDPNAPPPAPPPPAAPPPPERQSAANQFQGSTLTAKYDPKELEEDVELAPEQKKRVLDFFYRLDELDHYSLLGVAKEADKKTIKRSYFELASSFHPDRYFKKKLGSFKPKMEELFTRITEAHDTLVDPAKRAEYDAYTAEVASTRGMEALLERALAESAQVAAAAAAAAATAAPSIPPPVVSVPPPPVSEPARSAPGPSPDELRARREALARRLTGGARPAPQPAASSKPQEPIPSPHKYTSTQDAVDALRRRYEDRVESATQAHASKYVLQAEDALANNDLVAAATSLGIASKFAPNDAELATRAKDMKTLSDTTLAESYLKQAQYEERQQHWAEAASSWRKVAKIRPNDAVAHDRAAYAILHSRGADLHAAAEHAKQAITLEPQVVGHHAILVEIYEKAGLAVSARRALDAANALAPEDPQVQALVKRLK